MSFNRSGPSCRSVWLLALIAGSFTLAGCSNSSRRSLDVGVGVGTGVTLTTGDGTTSLEQGFTLSVSATVTNDVNSAGVTWTLAGAGSLSGATSATVTYVAPASGITGTASAVITASSNINPSATASATMTVRGAPVIEPLKLFPANQNIGYSATIPVSGGENAFSWSIVAGALPPGITLTSSTSALESISGVPTAQGSYTFTIQAVDGQSRTAAVPLTLLVNPQTACVLQGTYAFLYSGFTSGVPATQAGSLTISSTGTVTGVRDYKDLNGTTINDPITGTCTTTNANAGQLVLNGKTSTTTFNYAAHNPDTNNLISSGRLQLVNQGDDSGSGLFASQDPTAFGAASLAGNYAFGLLGAVNTASRQGLAGRLTLDATGTLSAGLADSNSATTPFSAATLTGSFSAPDPALGRGTASLAAAGQTYNLAYYVVSANRLFVIDSDAATGTPALSGFMTRQSGTFDATALANPGILSLWGAQGTADPITVISLGRLSNASSGAGTVDVKLDISNQLTATAGNPYSASAYSVAASGRGTLALSGTTRQFAMYLDGPANGYILEQGSTAGSAGLLEAQSTQALSNSICGLLVGGTQYPQARGPISLSPALFLSFGTLSSTFASGSFSIDATSGYGSGTFTQSAVGVTAASLYILQPDTSCSGGKVRMLRFGTRTIDASLEWFDE